MIRKDCFLLLFGLWNLEEFRKGGIISIESFIVGTLYFGKEILISSDTILAGMAFWFGLVSSPVLLPLLNLI